MLPLPPWPRPGHFSGVFCWPWVSRGWGLSSRKGQDVDEEGWGEEKRTVNSFNNHLPFFL